MQEATVNRIIDDMSKGDKNLRSLLEIVCNEGIDWVKNLSESDLAQRRLRIRLGIGANCLLLNRTGGSVRVNFREINEDFLQSQKGQTLSSNIEKVVFGIRGIND